MKLFSAAAHRCLSCHQKRLVASNQHRTFSGLSLFSKTEEHDALRSMLRTFVRREVEPQALEYNRNETFNMPLFRKLGDLGILGLTVSEEYGGAGLDVSSAVIAHEELSYSDPAFCLSYLAHSILFVNNLHVNGSHEQKLKWLPSACDGSAIGGMCISEPNAGTDVFAMSTVANYDQGSDSYILNGTKMWITNGTVDGQTTGDIFLVYAKTGPSRQDITQFVVEKDMPGFTVGQKITDKCGMRASMTAELVFQDVHLPKQSHVVGQVNGALLCMMRNLEIERITLAAMSLGIAKRAIDEMIRYSSERKAFGKELHHFGQIQNYLATSYAEFMAGRSYVYNVANNLDLSSHGNGLDADGVKLYCAPMAKNVADRAIQTMGGYGYVGQYVVERLWRDAKLLEIGGGTNESHHKNMTRDLRTYAGKLNS